MTKAELNQLRFDWKVAVCLGDRETQVLPCWFKTCIPGLDACEGFIQGCHWLKRQTVEGFIGRQLFGPGSDYVQLAAWDPRSGVPGCEKHHTRFDSQRQPTLVVPRELVPTTVEMFCADWGLEQKLEERSPPGRICPECEEVPGVYGGRCWECRERSMA